MTTNKIKDLHFDSFKLFEEQWALVTAGSFLHHNSMTISWGELGTLWHRDVVTIYVKPCRYTYSFMEDNKLFVVSFFDDQYKDALKVMGSISGRDVDKDKEAHLTPIAHNDVTIYKEAKLSLICKKIYFNDLVFDNIPVEEQNRHYNNEKPHRMYIGEIIEIIE